MRPLLHVATVPVRPPADPDRGPYLVIEGTGSNKGGWATEAPVRARQWDVLGYWNTHKHGADFLALDRGIKDFHDDHT